MLKSILKGFALSATIFMLLINQACEEPDEIGKDLLPPQDNLNVSISDSSSIHAFSYSEDSVKTSDPQVLLAGNYLDEIFGQTSAAFYTQLIMSTTNLDFGSNPVPDSVVLTLPYFSFYGDTTAIQTLEVYRLTEDLYSDTTYYSNEDINYMLPEIGTHTFTPKPQTPVILDNGDTLPPMVRIPIDDALASEFFYSAGSSVFDDNESFLDYFKGIHVKASINNGDGSILYFDPYSSNARMTIYYHNDDKDSLTASFYMGELSGKFSHFDHDYTTGNTMLADSLQEQVVQKDTLSPINTLFIQAMSGINVRIRFPYLDQWKDENIAINKATLIVKTNPADNSNDVYKEPLRLGLAKVVEDGKLELLTDYIISADIFDGYFNDNKDEYRFVITQHIQEILNGEEDRGLIMVSDKRSSNAYRAALIGPQAKDKNMRLELIYTELE